MLIRIIITKGTTVDCKLAKPLTDLFEAENLLADKGYDSNGIIYFSEKNCVIAVVPPRKNREIWRDFDEHIYKTRHLVENAFFHSKRRRGIATRYAKNTDNFRAAVQIRSIVMWAATIA